MDNDARQVFDRLIQITVGKGDKVLFWRDRWIHGFSVREIAPALVVGVETKIRNSRTVAQALEDERWALDVQPQTSFGALLQTVHPRHAVATVQRDVHMEDTFAWPHDPLGIYTASSTYDRLNQGAVRSPTAAAIWRSWAPLKCKIFAWLAVQHRLWTSDRRARHGLQDNTSPCYTCLQEEDTVEHIVVQCVYARQVWHTCFDSLQINVHPPNDTDTFVEWWLRARSGFQGKHKRGFDSVVIGAAWMLWKQRNAKVFNRPEQVKDYSELARAILEEIHEWYNAGVGAGGLDRFVREHT